MAWNSGKGEKMRVKKNDLVKAIDKVKGAVLKKPARPALGGVLVSNGYLTGANTEITIQVKLEGAEGESFIIPEKAFDLIKNLPDGELEVTSDDKDIVTIRMDKIKNSYQSFPAEDFIYNKTELDTDNGIQLSGKTLMESLSHVIYAAADKAPGRPALEGVCLEVANGCLHIVATDGHVMCWDQLPAEGMGNLKLIIPKSTVRRIIAMDTDETVQLLYTENSAVFKTEKFAIFTRLIEDNYIAYEKMFYSAETYTAVNRDGLMGAMTRAKMCTDEASPAIFDITNKEIHVIIRDNITNYQESVPLLEQIANPIKIGFSSKLVLETIKAFTCENISLKFSTPVTPMIVQAEDSDMKALVLPVRLRG